MRKLVILFLLVGMTAGQAQIIQLEEARVSAKNVPVKADGELKFSVVESYTNEFIKNPIAFMKKNFDIHLYIEEMNDKNFDSYVVEFRNTKGHLTANFDKEGTLLSTVQNFKNIPLPLPVARDLVRNHKGWIMTKNHYLASGKGDLLDKELYKVTLKNGKDTRRVKIIPERSSRGLASN